MDNLRLFRSVPDTLVIHSPVLVGVALDIANVIGFDPNILLEEFRELADYKKTIVPNSDRNVVEYGHEEAK